jgi:hypothetical protein
VQNAGYLAGVGQMERAASCRQIEQRTAPNEERTMKATRTVEAIRMRRELAQLLRRLRAIRRDKLAASELAERVSVALAEADSIRRFVAIEDVAEGGDHLCHTCLARVDKRKLSEAGLAPRHGELVDSCTI